MEQEETKKKKPTRLIIIGIAAVIIGVGVAYFISNAHYESTDDAQLDGNIVPIRSGVTAYINSIRFKDNQLVKKGDTLVCFDADELKAKTGQAEAALDNATANLLAVENNASASTENVNASVQTSESNQQNIISSKAKLEKCQKDFDRMSELLKIKAATQEQFETAQSNLQIAKADYNAAVNQEQSSTSTSKGLKAQANAQQNQIELAKALIKQRQAELVLAKKQLEYATVMAPCNGIVTKRAVQQGQYVSMGQSICSVVDDEHFWITANFKETQLKNIKPGQPVEITIDAFPDLKLTGKVESYSGATGAKFSLLPPDNSTGNFIKITQRFPLRISIDGLTKEKTAEMYPGLSAFVQIDTK